MRFVEITVPTGKREAIRDVLDDEGIDYVVTDETSGRDFTAVISFPLPRAAVEPILEDLREAGLDEDAVTVVLTAETVVSRRFDELAERFAEEGPSPERIAREEIRARAADLTPLLPSYVLLTLVSAVVATAGILLNSAAVVVGSMVIAPLIGPAMATSIGTVLDDRDLFLKGVRYQFLGLLAGVSGATVFALIVGGINLVPPGLDLLGIDQLRERLAPDFLSLAVALGAGVAGAYSLSVGVSSALVGVMIAVALVPPIAVVGIGIAWGLPEVVAGASVLALVNFLSINLAAIVTLWYQGYRPERWFRLDEARSATLTRVALLALGIAVLSVFLGWTTLVSYQGATFEQGVADDVEASLEGTDATLLEIEIRRTGVPPFQRPDRVIVTVGHPPDNPPPDLAAAIDARVDSRTGYDLTVEVRYVAIETA